MSEVKDMSLAPQGEQKIVWAKTHMPVLRSIEKEFSKTKPLSGLKITLSVHMEAKTAYLCRVLAAAGAEMHVTGCNPLSTQDDVAAAVAAGGIDVYARRGVTDEEYERHLIAALSPGPNIIIDDGGDLVGLLHTKLQHLLPGVIGGCEETTTGIHRLRGMERAGTLKFPMVMVNEARCKYLFDNRYGTGQSVWDGINYTTNLLVAGKDIVVSGYGWCGRGVASRAKGLGARVIVTEVDPVRAIEAVMDGHTVMKMDDAARLGDVFVTTTGCSDIIRREHFEVMKDRAILSNAGHFNVEIDVATLSEMASERFHARKDIEGFHMEDGRTLFVLAEGRLVNIAAGNGHPVEIMDMSFSIQALSAAYIAANGDTLSAGVVPVPIEIDDDVAARKLRAMGFEIDSLSDAQRAYLDK